MAGTGTSKSNFAAGKFPARVTFTFEHEKQECFVELWHNRTCHTFVEINILATLSCTMKVTVGPVPDLRYVDASCRLILRF